LPVSGVGLDDPAGTDGEPKGARLFFIHAMQLHSRKIPGMKSSKTERNRDTGSSRRNRNWQYTG